MDQLCYRAGAMRTSLLFTAALILIPSLSASAQDTPPAATELAPASAPPLVVATEPREQDTPVRGRRRFGVLGEVGWSGLSGLGPMFIYRPVSRVAIDAGFGLSTLGVKVGARGRYNFLESTWTPTLGAGLVYGFGTFGEALTIGDGIGPDSTVVLQDSPYLQIVGGVELCAQGGFTFLGTAGYSVLLTRNVAVQGADALSSGAQAVADVLYGSGIVFAVAFGYSF